MLQRLSVGWMWAPSTPSRTWCTDGENHKIWPIPFSQAKYRCTYISRVLFMACAAGISLAYAIKEGLGSVQVRKGRAGLGGM